MSLSQAETENQQQSMTMLTVPTGIWMLMAMRTIMAFSAVVICTVQADFGSVTLIIESMMYRLFVVKG